MYPFEIIKILPFFIPLFYWFAACSNISQYIDYKISNGIEPQISFYGLNLIVQRSGNLYGYAIILHLATNVTQITLSLEYFYTLIVGLKSRGI